MNDELFRRVANLKQHPQTQDSLSDQLLALKIAANKLGLYDAADWLTHRLRD